MKLITFVFIFCLVVSIVFGKQKTATAKKLVKLLATKVALSTLDPQKIRELASNVIKDDNLFETFDDELFIIADKNNDKKITDTELNDMLQNMAPAFGIEIKREDSRAIFKNIVADGVNYIEREGFTQISSNVLRSLQNAIKEENVKTTDQNTA